MVGVDDRRRAYEAVTHLLRLGYRRIAMINGARDVEHVAAGVSTAIKRALKDAEHAARSRARRARATSASSRATRAGIALLKRRPDAVFIANYLMAVGFMEALRQYQLRCPEDVALVTCDDYPWLDSFSPRLTTINLPKDELGAGRRRSCSSSAWIRKPRGTRAHHHA